MQSLTNMTAALKCQQATSISDIKCTSGRLDVKKSEILIMWMMQRVFPTSITAALTLPGSGNDDDIEMIASLQRRPRAINVNARVNDAFKNHLFVTQISGKSVLVTVHQ